MPPARCDRISSCDVRFSSHKPEISGRALALLRALGATGRVRIEGRMCGRRWYTGTRAGTTEEDGATYTTLARTLTLFDIPHRRALAVSPTGYSRRAASRRVATASSRAASLRRCRVCLRLSFSPSRCEGRDERASNPKRERERSLCDSACKIRPRRVEEATRGRRFQRERDSDE